MRFLFDQSADRRLAPYLRSLGHDVVVEARKVLGQACICGESPELVFGEAVYERLDFMRLILDIRRNKDLSRGGLAAG